MVVFLTRLACEIVVKYFLPAIRIVTTKELFTKYGKTQVEIAKQLDVTQAAVSKWLNDKVDKKVLELTNDKQIEAAGIKIAERIVKGSAPEEVLRIICDTCNALRHPIICNLHKELYGSESSCTLCIRENI